jgi:hypothetical protein
MSGYITEIAEGLAIAIPSLLDTIATPLCALRQAFR